MLLGEVVLKLRLGDTTFGEYIGGSAEFALAVSNTLTREMAFVVPLNDLPTEQRLDFGINQAVREKFGVVIALKNDTSVQDKLGVLAYNRIDTIRAELWKAILGWMPTDAEYPISYAGGKLMAVNPAWLWYEYDFNYRIRIDDDDGVVQEELDNFDTIYAQWVLSPDANIPISEFLPVSTFTPDAVNQIDLTEDPDAGEFGKGFNVIFDTYTG